MRFLPNEYRECADEDGVIRKYKVPVHEPSFKAGIKEVVEWLQELAIHGGKTPLNEVLDIMVVHSPFTREDMGQAK